MTLFVHICLTVLSLFLFFCFLMNFDNNLFLRFNYAVRCKGEIKVKQELSNQI